MACAVISCVRRPCAGTLSTLHRPAPRDRARRQRPAAGARRALTSLGSRVRVAHCVCSQRGQRSGRADFSSFGLPIRGDGVVCKPVDSSGWMDVAEVTRTFNSSLLRCCSLIYLSRRSHAREGFSCRLLSRGLHIPARLTRSIRCKIVHCSVVARRDWLSCEGANAKV